MEPNENEESFETVDHDVFDDSPETEETEETTTSEETKEEEKETSKEADDKTSEETEETGVKEETEGTPTSEQEETETSQDEEFIPKHRFTAALKNVTEELDATKAKLAELQQVKAPDPTEDPDGYNLHVRMETSKQVMRETVDDYDEAIQHFNAMAKENPQLNNAVAAHPTPAKYAYDIAKKSMRIGELEKTLESEDWKAFQNWKASGKPANQDPPPKKTEEVKADPDNSGKGKSAADVVPNLNRNPDANSAKTPEFSDDDDLFEGAL